MLRLCSTSITRAGILKSVGIDFISSPVDFDEETVSAFSARSFVYQASKGKIELAESVFGTDIQLLAADTVVEGPNGIILRKAKDAKEAEELLRLQSGAEIAILTCVHLKTSKYYFVDLSSTHYQFNIFDERDIKDYIDSGEWKGKAGACMVEGFCRAYIRKVHGFKSTAMGLQIEKLLPWLDR